MCSWFFKKKCPPGFCEPGLWLKLGLIFFTAGLILPKNILKPLYNDILFINSVDSVELFPRPPRKHCIPVMKKRTPSVGWSPILSGDFPPAAYSSLLLPSDSWNKLT